MENKEDPSSHPEKRAEAQQEGAKSHSVRSTAASSPKPKGAPSTKQATEVPKEPENIYHAFEERKDDLVPIGNPAYELMLKQEGKLGHFLPRNVCNQIPTYVNIDPQAIHNAAYLTLKAATCRLLRKQGYIEAVDIESRAEVTAQILARGVSIALYMKLRYIAFPDFRINKRFLKVPHVPTTFRLPKPFALAITQLGVFKVSSLPRELTLVPTFAENTQNFGLHHPNWSTTAYAQAREYAEKIGMDFEVPNLTVKLGSSWWLYDEFIEDDTYMLTCPFPEDNFTEETAILRTLFCVNDNGGFSNAIVNLAGIKTGNYGSMFRNPPHGVNESTFFAYCDDATDMINVV